MKIKINHENENLWCTYSKERIEIGEKYVEVDEEYAGEIIIKEYKLEYAPSEEDIEEDEPYLGHGSDIEDDPNDIG